MKKLFFYISIITLLIIFGIYKALDSGIIWCVNPSEQEYPVRGIDVSNHQGTIDWDKIPKQKVHFVYIKASEGGDFQDKSFILNWTQAKKNNFAVGAYHFFTLCKPGVEQAGNFINSVPKEDDSLPPVLDLEFTGNCKEQQRLTDIKKEIKDFLSIADRHYGKKVILYSTYEFIEKYLGSEFSDRDIWIRDIFKKPDLFTEFQWTIWQFNPRGTLPGIKGPVDMNVFNGTRDEFNKSMLVNMQLPHLIPNQ